MRSEFRQMAKRPKDFAFKTTSRKDLKKSTSRAQESRSWRRSQRLPVCLQASGGCDLGPSFFGCCSGERCPQPPAPGTSGDHREPPGPGRGGSQPPSQGQTPPVRSPRLHSSIFQHPAASRPPRAGSLPSARRPPARQGEPGPAAPGAISPPLLSAASPAPAAPSPGRRQRGAARHSPA